MCWRYPLATSRQQRAELFRLAGGPELPLRYNGAPTQPVPVVRPVHDRMPVMPRPYPAEEMEARAVSRRVNSPRYEGSDCQAPAG